MLDTSNIDRIAIEVSAAKLAPAKVMRVFSEPVLDSTGTAALSITIVIEPEAGERISGDAVLNTLVAMQDRLQEAGEERFAIVGYATEDELADSADT